MLDIIKERTPVTRKEYYIEFKYKDDPEAGFCFPATEHGDPDFSRMPSEAITNYERCLTDPRLTEGEYTINTHTYTEPAIGKCSCGRKVVLDSNYMGAVQCGCRRWHNVFGQELRDPKYWERDDDDYCFMACTEDI